MLGRCCRLIDRLRLGLALPFVNRHNRSGTKWGRREGSLVQIAERLRSRLDDCFDFGALRLPSVSQLGFVVESLEDARAQFGPMFSVREWYRPNIRSAQLRSGDREMAVDLAILIGYSDGLQIELIEVLGGEQSIFSDPTDNDLQGLHHIGFYVHQADAWRERFADHGLEAALHGRLSFARNSKTRIAYLDVRPQIGVYAELIENRIRGQYIPMGHWLVRLGVLFREVERLPRVDFGNVDCDRRAA